MTTELREAAAELRKLAVEGVKQREEKIAQLLVATKGLGLLAKKVGMVRDV